MYTRIYIYIDILYTLVLVYIKVGGGYTLTTRVVSRVIASRRRPVTCTHAHTYCILHYYIHIHDHCIQYNVYTAVSYIHAHKTDFTDDNGRVFNKTKITTVYYIYVPTDNI